MRRRFREIREIKEIKNDKQKHPIPASPEDIRRADAIMEQILDMFAEGELPDPEPENPTPVERADAIFDKCLDVLES